MAIGDYQVELIRAPEVSVQGYVNFDVWVQVQTEDDPAVWTTIDGGHRTMRIAGSLIVEIAEGVGTDAEKRWAIGKLITDQVEFIGLAASDKANAALLSVYPNGEWPEGGFVIPLEVD